MWGATDELGLELIIYNISIHAPRVGSDAYSSLLKEELEAFQSTLPVWGATKQASPMIMCTWISIHAPRVGSDRRRQRGVNGRKYFNPRSPCGERRHRPGQSLRPRQISIHAPRVGSDSKDAQIFLLHLRQKGCFFVIFSKLGAVRRKSAEKGGGIFLQKSVRTSRGKYGCLAFAFRESGGLRENRRFYSQSVLFSFRIDCQGSRIAGCPFRGP